MFQLDTKAFVKSMVAAASTLKVSTLQALKRTSAAAATYARMSRLYKARTHKLRASIQDHGLVSDVGSRVSANAKYARYLEDGTKAHVIGPRTSSTRTPKSNQRKTLSFVQNGTRFFRTSVFHPGTQPRPFMKEASHKAEPLFDRLCREAVDHMFG